MGKKNFRFILKFRGSELCNNYSTNFVENGYTPISFIKASFHKITVILRVNGLPIFLFLVPPGR